MKWPEGVELPKGVEFEFPVHNRTTLPNQSKKDLAIIIKV